QQLLQLVDLGLLVRADDVQRLEVVVDVNAEPGPGLLLVLRRDLRCAVGQVADVPNAGLDHVPGAEVALDRLRLGRRLHDHEPAAAGHGLGAVGHADSFSPVVERAREGCTPQGTPLGTVTRRRLFPDTTVSIATRTPGSTRVSVYQRAAG